MEQKLWGEWLMLPTMNYTWFDNYNIVRLLTVLILNVWSCVTVCEEKLQRINLVLFFSYYFWSLSLLSVFLSLINYPEVFVAVYLLLSLSTLLLHLHIFCFKLEWRGTTRTTERIQLLFWCKLEVVVSSRF